MPKDQRPTVSIVIKAFNEERHIAGAIESALAALAGIDGEIILADGASTDRTVSIAEKYPVKIVRLDKTADRSCGAGAQLGFQYSRGEFICLMDGDMHLRRSFLAAGLGALRENPALAGVGGAVVDHDADNLEYAQRVRRFDPDRRPGPVTRLGGCGLYRRAAIEAGLQEAKESQEALEKAEAKVAEMLEEARKEADDILARTHQESAGMIAEAESKAKTRAEQIVADARQQLSVDVSKAREALKKDTVELVALATERVIGEKLDERKDADLVKKALAEEKAYGE